MRECIVFVNMNELVHTQLNNFFIKMLMSTIWPYWKYIVLIYTNIIDENYNWNMSNSGIRILAHLWPSSSLLYKDLCTLFPISISRVSCSRHQHDIRVIAPLTAVGIECCSRHSWRTSSSHSSTLSSLYCLKPSLLLSIYVVDQASVVRRSAPSNASRSALLLALLRLTLCNACCPLLYSIWCSVTCIVYLSALFDTLWHMPLRNVLNSIMFNISCCPTALLCMITLFMSTSVS